MRTPTYHVCSPWDPPYHGDPVQNLVSAGFLISVEDRASGWHSVVNHHRRYELAGSVALESAGGMAGIDPPNGTDQGYLPRMNSVETKGMAQQSRFSMSHNITSAT
jgi:hypothetical protein